MSLCLSEPLCLSCVRCSCAGAGGSVRCAVASMLGPFQLQELRDVGLHRRSYLAQWTASASFQRDVRREARGWRDERYTAESSGAFLPLEALLPSSLFARAVFALGQVSVSVENVQISFACSIHHATFVPEWGLIKICLSVARPLSSIEASILVSKSFVTLCLDWRTQRVGGPLPHACRGRQSGQQKLGLREVERETARSPYRIRKRCSAMSQSALSPTVRNNRCLHVGGCVAKRADFHSIITNNVVSMDL